MHEDIQDCCMCGEYLSNSSSCYHNGHSPMPMSVYYNKDCNLIQQEKKMNYSTAVMLINTNIRAIKVTYELDTDKLRQQRYTYKTLDASIKVGDYVIVPTETRHNMTVCRVEEVDVDVDFEDSTEIKWIVDRVNKGDHDNILKEESKWIEALKQSEKRRKREEIKKSMLEMYQDEGIEKLPIANMAAAVDATLIESK